MSTLCQGRIVHALDAICDPQGRNPKENRPFVVVSTPEEIDRDDDLHLVAISSRPPTSDDDVPLPWAAGGRCMTGLSMPSVAVCSWTERVPQDRVTVGRGFVRPSELEQILRNVFGE